MHISCLRSNDLVRCIYCGIKLGLFLGSTKAYSYNGATWILLRKLLNNYTCLSVMWFVSSIQILNEYNLGVYLMLLGILSLISSNVGDLVFNLGCVFFWCFMGYLSTNNKATQSPEISREQVQKLTLQFLLYIYWI